MDPAKLFTEHPASVGETYGEHLVMASGFGFRMILGGMACLIHGLLPFLFVKTGSSQIAGRPSCAPHTPTQIIAST